ARSTPMPAEGSSTSPRGAGGFRYTVRRRQAKPGGSDSHPGQAANPLLTPWSGPPGPFRPQMGLADGINGVDGAVGVNGAGRDVPARGPVQLQQLLWVSLWTGRLRPRLTSFERIFDGEKGWIVDTGRGENSRL